MKAGTITRRQVLGLAAGALLSPVAASSAERRFAVIDWAVLETALAIGAVPAAATELVQFREIVIEPDVPAEVADIGLRGTPNHELLRIVAPDLILSSNFYEYQRASLEHIAPVTSVSIYEPGKAPYEPAEEAAQIIGQLLGRETEAAHLVDESRSRVERVRARLKHRAGRPVFVISIGDARHFRAFGADSMFGDVLGRLGFQNAWHEATSYSAAAPVGFEALARVPEASVVVISPVPPEARLAMSDNALWNALPMVREGRVMMIDPVNHFGGLPAGLRFARLFSQTMLSGDASNG